MKLKCPHCGKWVEYGDTPYGPFCSERCRLIDLGKWIEEEYKILADEAPPPLNSPGKEQAKENKGKIQ